MEKIEDVLSRLTRFVHEFYHDYPEVLSIKTRSGRKIFLSFPVDRPIVNEGPPQPAPPPIRHSEDYRSVTWYGEQYQFTTKQAMIVQRLWEAMLDESPDMSGASLIEAAESDCNQLRDLFRTGGKTHEAWGTMIVAGAKKGTYRLSVG